MKRNPQSEPSSAAFQIVKTELIILFKFLKDFPVSAITAFFLIVVLARLVVGGLDFSFFIAAGDYNIDPVEHPFDILIQENSRGYDGQFFYALALDPNIEDGDLGIIHSEGNYRKQRIAYPLLSKIVAFNQANLIPFSLVLTNVLLLILGLVFLKAILKERNAEGSYLFIFLLLPGLYIALTRDLAEIAQFTFLIATILSLLKRNILGFAVAGSMAILSKEVTLIVVSIGALCLFIEIIQRKDFKNIFIKIIGLASPIIVFICWQYVLQASSGTGAKGHITYPFVGIYNGIISNYHIISGYSEISSMYRGLYFTMFYGLLIFSFWIILMGLRSAIKNIFHKDMFQRFLSWSYFPLLLLALTLNHKVYESEFSFGRVLIDLQLISLLLAISNKKKFTKQFIFFGFLILALTIARLVIRP
jgi:hypothetical protein